MKIIHYSEPEPTYIDSDIAKGVSVRVAIGKADGAENFCMRIFELSKGGYSPRHSHEWEHEMMVHSGSGEILCSGKWVTITKGSIVFIPGNEEHQIKNTGDEPLVFVCLIPSGIPEI